jgi:PAS domain S-box-containing protein
MHLPAFFLFLICTAALSAQPAGLQSRSILVIQSYQQGPAWVQNIADGILSVFKQSRDFSYVYRFEYMNILDADPSTYPEIYRQRLGSFHFDVVIGVDNQALEFLIENRAELFAGVPIVFCSVDDYTEDMLEGESDVTGVTGELDFEGTIRLARRLHPDMSHLVVLANRSLVVESAAYAVLEELIREKFRDQMEIEYWEDPKLSEVLERAGAFPPDTVIFDMAFLEDDAGKPLSLPASTRRASQALDLPIYSCWETLLGNGIVGGVISGGFHQGEAAGELALSILRGADPDSLPVVREGTNRPMFDYEQLKRFRIPEKRLPENSIFINRPSSLYVRYRSVLWAFFTVVAALLVLLILSWLYIAGQQRLRRRIQRSEERLSLALAATNSGIWEYYPQTKEAFYDTRWFTMLGYEPGSLPSEYKSWADLLHPEDRQRTERTVHRHVVNGQDYTLEFRMRTGDGDWRWISSSGKIVERDSAGSALRIVGTHVDITERKRIRAELERAYQTLERRVQERTKELAVLNSIAAVVSRSLDLGEIMESALEKTMEASDLQSGAAYIMEDETRTLVLMAHRGLSEPFVDHTSRIPLEAALAGKNLSTEQPVIWPMAEYPEGELKSLITEEGLKLVIGVPVTSKERLLGGLIISSRTPRSVSAEESSLFMAIGRQIGLAVENARLYELERTKHEEEERRRTVAEGMREILAVLNSNRPLQETLDFIINQTCRVTGSDAASLLQREAGDEPFIIQSSCGLDADYVSTIRFSAGRGGAGRALKTRQPVVLSDAAAFVDQVAHDPDSEYQEEKKALELMIERGFHALLSVPLVIKEEDYGGITLYYREAREFSEEEIQLATSVADQAALAIENARLRTQAERAAAFAERSRLARELHDSVTQSLYSIALYAEAVTRMLASGSGSEAAEHLHELRETALEALREMRLLIFQLSPPLMDEGGLVGAIQVRLDAVEARGGMDVNLQVEGEEHLSPPVRRELYQIAQEALNNALKHARAQAVRVILDFRDPDIRLEVSDDGCGFDLTEAKKGGGLGLRGMKERIQAIGGTLHIESSPGKGTMVSVRVSAAETTS